MIRNIQGTAVPALGFGTWQLRGDVCYNAVRDALDIGYRHIDTARIYENEEEVGRALQNHGLDRADVFLTSKIWYDDLKRNDFIAATEQSLATLNTDYLDLLLIHWPNADVPLEETLDAMATCLERRLIRHGGVSNFPPALLGKALTLFPVFCNQVEHHIYLGQERIRKICEENDLLLTAFSPLARGDLTTDPVLHEIGQAHGKSASQVALRWLLHHPQIAVLPRSSNPKRRRENFGVDDFELSPEEIERIDRLPKNRRGANPPFAPDWELELT